MPINRLYDTWKSRITELRPGQRITQIRSFVWLIVGIYLSRSVYLSRVAGKIPGEAQLTSATRRLSRLLDNPPSESESGMSRLPGSGCKRNFRPWARSV